MNKIPFVPEPGQHVAVIKSAHAELSPGDIGRVEKKVDDGFSVEFSMRDKKGAPKQVFIWLTADELRAP